jgi:DNA mismatch repair protein MutH
MNADDKNNVKLIWENTKNLISEGKAFNKMSDGKFYTNFLGEAKTEICHVRPHGKDSTDFRKIPVQDIKSGTYVLPKYSFWFNHDYLNKIVNEQGEIE